VRRRAAKGSPDSPGATRRFGAFVSLLTVPLSHDDVHFRALARRRYGFIIWGLINGVYLVVNHGWRVYAAHPWRDKAAYARWTGPVGSF
jgi:hypothetical protein